MAGRRASLVSFLDDAAARSGRTLYRRRRGLRAEERSYGWLRDTSLRLATVLAERGISRGDRVLIWSANRPEWVAGLFACLARGAVAVPLEEGSSESFAAAVQRQVGARALLHDGKRAGIASSGLATVDLDALPERLEGRAPGSPEPVGRDDLAEVVFTSGTTSEPRGVCLSHGNLLANLAPVEEEIARLPRWTGLLRPVRFLSPLPFGHVFGQYTGIFVPQLLAGQVLLDDPVHPGELIRTLREQRISVLAAVPRQLETLKEAVERAGGDSLARRLARAEGRPLATRLWALRHVRGRFGWRLWVLVCAGASLSPEVEAFWRRLGFAVTQAYGMTETSSMVTAYHPLRTRHGSVGKALPGTEIRVSASGEILVRGPSVSPGYWRGEPVPITDADGWLHTGDQGELDDEGNVVFKGRSRDVIVTGSGSNVFPDDLERALAAQPEVSAASVYGIEGPGGPEPMAVLILRDRAADAEAVVARANAALAPHQRIRRWHVWTGADFPRTAGTRKVIKRRLAAAVARAAASTGRADEPAASPVAAAIAELAGAGALSSGSALGSALDSLGRVALLGRLEERYQVELDEAAFSERTTVAEVERMLSERSGAAEAHAPFELHRWPQRGPGLALRRLLSVLLVQPLTRLLCRVRVGGREHLPDGDSPVILVSNHVTMIDHALLLSALPWRLRPRVAIAMEGERLRRWRHPDPAAPRLRRAFWIGVYWSAVLLFAVFPLPRRSGFRRSFAFAGESMDRGCSLLVFPEGVRTRDGRLGPFQPGIGLLVSQLGAPVVPARIDGLYELRERWPPIRPGRVEVRFGAAVSYPSGSEPAAITADLERRVRALGGS